VLVTLLAKLWDEKGRVTVPHFYDAVRPVSSAELASLHTTFDEETYKQRFGIRAFSKEENYSPIESNWVRPTLELNGIGGGYTGTGFKTVIPAKAIAKISCRLVPDQDPDKIAQGIIDFLKAKAPQGIELTATMHHGSKAYRSSPEAPIAKICVRAFEKVFGKTCQMQLCGATIPIVAELAIASGSEVALIGMGLAEDNIHAPNEHFGMDRFEQGFLVMTTILHELAEK
jgi:acetylornithine deacetylase/succinyl-diaminopimelate desuccinylase-like protein